MSLEEQTNQSIAAHIAAGRIGPHPDPMENVHRLFRQYHYDLTTIDEEIAYLEAHVDRVKPEFRDLLVWLKAQRG